jgi:hypothetical protein
MFVEKKIESVIRDQLQTDFTGVLSDSVTIRTFFAENQYDADNDDSEVDVDFPVVFLAASPNVRESGHLTQRTVSINVVCMTQFNDDYDRNDLQTVYATARKTIETTAFDFGSNIAYSANSYEVTDGFASIEENIQQAGFSIDLHICAGDFEWDEG